MNALIFGSSGTLGKVCLETFTKKGANVETVSRNLEFEFVEGIKFDAIIWAQGKNITASFLETSEIQEFELFDANYFFITRSLRKLLSLNLIENKARLVILSSVWENLARSNKTSYIASKSAVGGLVRALATELGSKFIQINAVLPGVIDSNMTRANLTESQLQQVKIDTPGNNLIEINQVANLVYFLASSDSEGINGQSIIIDSGWSQTHEI
jgi:NAD(P)-dependent dehydrogenase (short-subunit alcohol dehydrogenase family)